MSKKNFLLKYDLSDEEELNQWNAIDNMAKKYFHSKQTFMKFCINFILNNPQILENYKKYMYSGLLLQQNPIVINAPMPGKNCDGGSDTGKKEQASDIPSREKEKSVANASVEYDTVAAEEEFDLSLDDLSVFGDLDEV